MSKISLTPNASGTGTFTIASPNSNTDRTLTLPDEAGTVLTSASDIEAQVKTATNASGSAPVYAARAWVNFNGTGTVAIRASGNVSSITDEGTGTYTINFTTAMPDTDYSLLTNCPAVSTGRGGYFVGIDSSVTSILTTSVRIRTSVGSTAASDAVSQDLDYVHAAIVR